MTERGTCIYGVDGKMAMSFDEFLSIHTDVWEEDLVACAWCMTINSLDYKFSKTFFYEFIRKEQSEKIVKHVAETKRLFHNMFQNIS